MSVSVTGLTKRFTAAGTPAVSGVTFAAPRGGITALLGPSGAGKSTVLRLIAGLEAPDAGRIEIDGEEATRLPARERGVGLVFQGYALFRHLSVRENVGFGLRVRGAPRSRVAGRVDELLSLVELRELAGRYPEQLSGGQQQRVAFARALAVEPRVLLLDEPFAALDVRVRHELREWLRRLHAETGVTTLLVTHDQGEAFDLAHHVVILFDGRVVQAGTPDEIYDRPASAPIASFLGGANVLSGRVEEGRARLSSVSVAAPAAARDGQAVRAFVRPHEVTILKEPNGHRGATSALVTRVVRSGGHVRMFLRLPAGEVVSVETPLREAEALGAAVGSELFVDLGAAKVFVEDWSI